MGTEEMIPRKEADAKIDALTDRFEDLKQSVDGGFNRIEALLQEHGKVSGENKTEIAVLKQRMDSGDRWRLVFGGAALGWILDFVSRKIGR